MLFCFLKSAKNLFIYDIKLCILRPFLSLSSIAWQFSSDSKSSYDCPCSSKAGIIEFWSSELSCIILTMASTEETFLFRSPVIWTAFSFDYSIFFALEKSYRLFSIVLIVYLCICTPYVTIEMFSYKGYITLESGQSQLYLFHKFDIQYFAGDVPL